MATDEGSTAADTFTTQTESVGGESSQVVSVPSLKTVFLEKASSKEDVLAIEKPLEDLGVNVRLHDVNGKVSCRCLLFCIIQLIQAALSP